MIGSPDARELLATALIAQSPAWRNAADLIRAGGSVNAWVVAALVAIDEALGQGSVNE